MSDDAAKYFVRAYSIEDGNSVTYLCEDCAEIKTCYGVNLIQIEEYESEETFDFVAMYSCVECGVDQREKGESVAKAYKDTKIAAPHEKDDFMRELARHLDRQPNQTARYESGRVEVIQERHDCYLYFDLGVRR